MGQKIPDGLTERRVKFAYEYVKDFHVTNAAIRAGYSPDSAHVEGSRLLNNAKVQELLAQLTKKQFDKLEITAERTKLEIARLAFADPKKFLNADGTLKNIHELDDDTAAAIAGFEVEETFEDDPESNTPKKRLKVRLKKIKKHQKEKALEMLAKHFKLYSDAPFIPINTQPLTDTQVDKLIEAIRSNKQG
jgi:phage terminase small subunit